jgi:hypothetical protein
MTIENLATLTMLLLIGGAFLISVITKESLMEVERTFEYWREMAIRKNFESPEVVAVGLTLAEILENIREAMTGVAGQEVKVEVKEEFSSGDAFTP